MNLIINFLDAAVVITPCYFKNKMTSSALEKHFLAVADASKVPVILYSVPANTGIDLAVDVVLRLAKHQNIIGIKVNIINYFKLNPTKKKFRAKSIIQQYFFI